MTLLEALVETTKQHSSVRDARMAYFAFSDNENAFISEIELEELVLLLEEWCRQQRFEMKPVN